MQSNRISLKYNSETTKGLWIFLKDEAGNLNSDIASNDNNNNNFRSFKYKAKLLGNPEADGANKTLKNETIATPLKYLSNFFRSLEMRSIDCKVELKQSIVLPTVGADNTNANPNDIVFTIKGTK